MNYRMPAEWETHDAVWLAWPWDTDSFGYLNQKGRIFNPQSLPNVEKTFIKIIDALRGSEQVKLLKKSEIDYQDVWTRDYMPTFVKDDGSVVAVKWNYDVYGGKWKKLLKDSDVWAQVNKDIKTVEPEITLEGGAIDVDGAGMLVTTKQCLKKRNKDISEKQYEDIFAKYLGVSKTIWLEKGLVNDHTDGHVDDIARFVAPGKIVCAFEDNSKDENYEILKNNYEVLAKSCEVIKLPMPHMNYADGNKAPVSYCNFYIGNKVVLVPTFNDPNDQKALEIIQSCFPERKIIGIDCVDLIYGGGTIHCVTQQVPKP